MALRRRAQINAEIGHRRVESFRLRFLKTEIPAGASRHIIQVRVLVVQQATPFACRLRRKSKSRGHTQPLARRRRRKLGSRCCFHFFIGPFQFYQHSARFPFLWEFRSSFAFPSRAGYKEGDPPLFPLCFSDDTTRQETFYLTIKNQATRWNGRKARATSMLRLRCDQYHLPAYGATPALFWFSAVP